VGGSGRTGAGGHAHAHMLLHQAAASLRTRPRDVRSGWPRRAAASSNRGRSACRSCSVKRRGGGDNWAREGGCGEMTLRQLPLGRESCEERRVTVPVSTRPERRGSLIFTAQLAPE
jgi:hypothetical protein